MKAFAERAHDVELVAGAKHIQATRARARHLVEKFQFAVRDAGAVDAHGAAQIRLLA